jgi:hypothetical protein
MLRWLSLIYAVSIPGIVTGGETGREENGFHPYPESPTFTILARHDTPESDDCTRCHDREDTDPEPRRLRTRHVREIDHGGNRFWCMTCHDGENIGFLRTSTNDRIDFEHSYLICGSCHANRQKDWYFGGHGKRVSGWQGERIILTCIECHDPHLPAAKPRKPGPPPPVRIGLEMQKHDLPATNPEWEP